MRGGVWKSLSQIQKESGVVDVEVVVPVEKLIKKRFCEFCDSKGHFHKKDCTRNNQIDKMLD